MRRVAIALLMLAASCGGDSGPVATPGGAMSTATAAPRALEQSCTGQGFTISYPDGWHTNEEGEPCKFFHPGAFELPEATEVLGLAIVVEVAEAPFEEISEPEDEVLDRSTSSIAAADAVRVRTRAGPDAGLLPEGTLSVVWYVDLGEATLVASTHNTAGGFDDNVEVLDAMVRSLEFREECSSSELEPDPAEQEGLPDEVAAQRSAIVGAAVACDYDTLEALAGPDFTYSFGEDGEPAAFWRRLEEEGRGPKPLRYLVELLDRPHGTKDGSFVWPSAYAHDRWSDVPEADREALRPLYGDEDFEAWARFGSYIGYRIAISEEGDWELFVAGD